MKIVKRSRFTLLEVLVGFFLLVIALVPLLAPYPYMLKSQEDLLYELEMDRLASLYYVDLLQKVLKEEIDPSAIEPGEVRRVEQKLPIPFKAAYIFGEGEVKIAFYPLASKSETPLHVFTYAL